METNERLMHEMLTFLNKVRSEPKFIIPYLKKYMKRFKGNEVHDIHGVCNMLTNEGKSCVQELIDVLEKQKPIEKLECCVQINKAAQDHADDCDKVPAILLENLVLFTQPISSILLFILDLIKLNNFCKMMFIT